MSILKNFQWCMIITNCYIPRGDIVLQTKKELIHAKIKCSNCHSIMELIGVTESGDWKYYCSHCHSIIEICLE